MTHLAHRVLIRCDGGEVPRTWLRQTWTDEQEITASTKRKRSPADKPINLVI